MDPRPEVQALKKKIEVLEEENQDLKAVNQDLMKQLKEIGITEKKELAILGLITANQSTIAANTQQITKFLNDLNATTTEGTIPRHLSFHFLLSFPWIELLISTSFCKLNILGITITTKILIFLLASDF